jgi:hypothetical protein
VKRKKLVNMKNVTLKEVAEHWEGVKVSMLAYRFLRGVVHRDDGLTLYTNQVSGAITVSPKEGALYEG